jgi:hypothetical protein
MDTFCTRGPLEGGRRYPLKESMANRESLTSTPPDFLHMHMHFVLCALCSGRQASSRDAGHMPPLAPASLSSVSTPVAAPDATEFVMRS